MLDDRTTWAESEQRDWWPMALLLSLFAVVLVRNAWLAEDAYITFRTVKNFIDGYGLTWNTTERVQAYTHPLWMFLMSAFAFVTREIYFTSIFVCLLVSLATVALLVFKVARTQFSAYLAIAVLLFSKAYIDWSVSGLENPLTHLGIVAFAIVFFGVHSSYKKLFWLSLIASLSAVNRMDTALLFAPPILYELIVTVRHYGWKNLRWLYALGAGAAPLVLWLAFATFYYGFPFPNTAYAKLNIGIPKRELYKQGMYYYLNSLNLDPLTLTVVLVGMLLPLYSRRWRDAAVALGIGLYLLYIVRIGGDFMSGRFFTGPLVAAVVLLAANPITSVRTLAPALLVVGVVGFSAPFPPLLSTADFGTQDRETLIDNKGIADERAYYYPSTGLLRASRSVHMPDSIWVQEAFEARDSGASVGVRGNIGYFGYFVGPKFQAIDLYGLSDPMLARLPAIKDRNWRIGHFIRRVPEGYLETLDSGQNSFADQDLAQFYEKLLLVTRGNLFDRNRLVEIWNMNTGTYEHLIDFPFYRYGGKVVSLAELAESTAAETAASQTQNAITFSGEGLQVKLGQVYHAQRWDVSLEDTADYQVIYFRGNEELGAQVLSKTPAGGMYVHRITVPEAIAAAGYDRMIFYPATGDAQYRIGHLSPRTGEHLSTQTR